jgi:hypothetical protein
MIKKLLLLFMGFWSILGYSASTECYAGYEIEKSTVPCQILKSEASRSMTSDEPKSIDSEDRISVQETGSFTISPNPATNTLNIIVLDDNTESVLQVFDVLGKQILKRRLTRLETKFDVSNWKSGIYLVKVSNDKGSQTKRFIKQ